VSNYSVMTIASRESDVQAIRGRCRDRMNQVHAEQRRFADHLRKQASACSQMASEIARIQDLGAGVDMSLKNLDNSINALESNLQALASEAASLANHIEETARVGNQVLTRAHQDNRALAADQQATEQRLAKTANETHELSLRIERLTRELDRQMQEANRLVDAIEHSKSQHRQIDRTIDQDLDALHSAARALQGVIGQWVDLSSHLSELNLNVDSHIQEIQVLAEAVTRSPALYALLENLRDFQFEHLEVFENGLEAFFVDENERRVTITSRRPEKPADVLLDSIRVTIDLSGFDAEGETVECDEALEELLDLDGAVIVTRTTESPKKAPGPDAREREAPRSRTRKRESRQRSGD
jgi:chromosome segregation ATPase